MNFLAHFHLSGEDEEIAIGNFIGDFIRGSKLDDLPENVLKGIQLHRFIDAFTDKHPVVKSVNQIIKPYFSKYAPVVSDIYFDYFLASNFDQYSTQSLRDYTHEIYDLIERKKELLPERARGFYHFLLERDIFFEYGNKDGMRHVFNGVSSRAKFKSNMEEGVPVLIKHESEILPLFHEFYPTLQKASSQFLEELNVH
jgi:acyl carrier protein phosphodiesterase